MSATFKFSFWGVLMAVFKDEADLQNSLRELQEQGAGDLIWVHRFN